MAIKSKLIIAIVLAVALVVVLFLPPTRGDEIRIDDSIVAMASFSAQDENDIATGLPVATSEWYFVLLTDLTGSNSEAGVAAAWGFDYGIKSLNETGGPRGVAVKSAVRDTASVTEKAAAEMTTVVSVSKSLPEALLVFGPVVPQQYNAAAASFTKAHVPVVGNMPSAKSLDDFAPYAVSSEVSPGVSAKKAVAAWLNAGKGIKKIALVYDSSVEALCINADSVKSAVSESEIEVIATITTSGDSFDAADVAEEALKSGADAYYIDLPGDGNKRIAEQLIHMSSNIAPKMLLGTYSSDVSQLLPVDAFNTDKIFFWSDFDLTADAGSRKAFKDAFDAAIGNDNYYGLSADYCQAAQFAMQAIEQLELTGDPARIDAERKMLTDYLRNCNRVESFLGDYSTVEGEKVTSPSLYHIKSGRFVRVQ